MTLDLPGSYSIKTVGFALLLSTCMFLACGKSPAKQNSIELINDLQEQHLLFKNLVDLTNHSIPEDRWNDSLAFLVLPVQASCPACRNKTIDSIVKHQFDLSDKHFIIISAKGGMKTISGYFYENDKTLPVIKNKLFLDSTNKANQYGLYDKKPTMYYTYNRKVYKKVAAIPSTVRDDLREFFNGSRHEDQVVQK